MRFENCSLPRRAVPLSRNLQTLIAKGLVERGPPGTNPVEEYGFRHILIQEAAYRAIPKSLRAELHHRFADWLEYVFLTPAMPRPEILGYHLEQSVRYLRNCGPPRPSQVLCRAGRPYTLRTPAVPLMIVATTSRH